ncbi:MAG: metal-binding protein [Candidatus Dactylopiibacterium carminicum]|uniref:Large ribosomal RNA subunit accumulation protein YceD n=1 Tax=Candidatus Dactylopiibacterium carminicum TaxID=857335 RepID=A0A272ESS5_9RHOO|nr:YceD family protein [Candidatus Dactylopiibacterium carminicum]KAF7599101.1 metal-binding protein [Candidatus Dactylopiibacterium carminicum]PAS93138.1 MAG: metal-binding protein [Candidatus Dactylopiibacterium carminicum]PAS96890.1 MAG: metal-binding protein [Candidatus Dactylopiibacterium carminicum]PAS99115.1 MAG: hypothetical protein BSR46_09780 [Candidatus Dactylopiibacterium carminicum]
MSHQQPLRQRFIADPFEFARRGDELAGELDARELSRVAEMLWSVQAAQPVRYVLSGTHVDGKGYLSIDIDAVLVMQCQRCLGDVECRPQAHSRLMLVRRGEPLPDEDLEHDDFDPVHAGRDFDVLEAVEEELLLALPLAPAHDACSLPGAGNDGAEGSPFAVLKGLKLKGA